MQCWWWCENQFYLQYFSAKKQFFIRILRIASDSVNLFNFIILETKMLPKYSSRQIMRKSTKSVYLGPGKHFYVVSNHGDITWQGPVTGQRNDEIKRETRHQTRLKIFPIKITRGSVIMKWAMMINGGTPTRGAGPQHVIKFWGAFIDYCWSKK